ncbi:hypothetical protein D3C87_1630090 [compost metagenome]
MPSLTRSARLVLARTSEPPCFSVMPMPMVMAVFCIAGLLDESYLRARIFGTHSRCTCGAAEIAATEALVMVSGQRWPDSSCAVRKKRTARALCSWPLASVCGSQTEECRPTDMERRISACQAGWNSTMSSRSPRTPWVRSFGGLSFAMRASSWASWEVT